MTPLEARPDKQRSTVVPGGTEEEKSRGRHVIHFDLQADPRGLFRLAICKVCNAFSIALRERSYPNDRSPI